MIVKKYDVIVGGLGPSGYPGYGHWLAVSASFFQFLKVTCERKESQVRKRLVVLAMMVISLYGCSQVQVRDVRATNELNLQKLQFGMSKREVVEIMGTGAEKVKEEVYYQGFLAGYRELEVQNPYRTEIKKIGNRTYEILYYYADIFGMRMGYWDASYRERKVTDNVLTPLIFENNRLIGWGWRLAQEKGFAEEDLTGKTDWMLWGR